MVELTSSAYFQDDVDVCFIMEEAVHLDDVGMVQKLLNLQLSRELLDDFFLHYDLLLDHLQGADEA